MTAPIVFRQSAAAGAKETSLHGAALGTAQQS
jgi:hypothetical protein